ncbi:MAG: GNAT family N-acetyltransferase [Armatimonadetes bacterium]|nr:GNAT family N-acetyltransferase [Armatimonadota bacterium]
MASGSIRHQPPAPVATLGPSAPAPARQSPPLRIRAARRAEVAQVNQLRARSFNLPLDTWPAADRITAEELRGMRVLARDGRILSCLTVERRAIRLARARLPMGGIRHVASLPEERNQGYASALMRGTLHWMRAEGLPVSILFPTSFGFYRNFGYELGGNHCEVWARPASLPAFEEARWCRPAGLADVDTLQRLFESRSAVCACTPERSASLWQKLLAQPDRRAILFENEAPAGYLLATETLDRYGAPVTRVHELLAVHEEARRGLLGWLARCTSESIEWSASTTDLMQSGLLHSPALLREGFRPRVIVTVRPMFQFRVVDLTAALRARAPAWSNLTLELSLQVHDEIIRENEIPIALSARDGTVQLVSGHCTAHCLAADIRVFSQIYCGYMAPSEAASQGLLLQGSPEAVRDADFLFPRLEPFIPDLDRF